MGSSMSSETFSTPEVWKAARQLGGMDAQLGHHISGASGANSFLLAGVPHGAGVRLSGAGWSQLPDTLAGTMSCSASPAASSRDGFSATRNLLAESAARSDEP